MGLCLGFSLFENNCFHCLRMLFNRFQGLKMPFSLPENGYLPFSLPENGYLPFSGSENGFSENPVEGTGRTLLRGQGCPKMIKTPS